MTTPRHFGAGPLYLSSGEWVGLADWLATLDPAGPVLVLTAASADLPDATAMVAPLVSLLREAHIDFQMIADPTAARGRLACAGALVMPGGDPFRLLRELRRSGFDREVQDRARGGLPVAGQSAGAMVCGPSLEPIIVTSPFAPDADDDLSGLGLTSTVILPHHDRPDRAARHRRAALEYGAQHRLAPLWDDEVRLEDGADWQIRTAQSVTRSAVAADAAAISQVFGAAARAGWASFLGAATLAGITPDIERWAARLADGCSCLLAEDAQGVLGFVIFRQLPEAAPVRGGTGRVGELDLLYVHPRAWGRGIGRRLMDRATFALLAEGCEEAWLWTEARNRRALELYRGSGWQPDGAVDARAFLGEPIRNVRLTLDLTVDTGGLGD